MRTASWIATGVLVALCGVSAQAQVAVTEYGHFADVSGARIYYEERGSGEPLLLLHNFFNTAAGWDAYVDDLATRYRVIAWDMRGHGRSNNPSTADVFRHEVTGRDLLALMDRLGIERAKAIGASSGAQTLLHAATREPARFEAMVLVGSRPYFEPQARENIRKAPFLEDPETVNALEAAHGEAKLQRLGQLFRRAATLYGDPAFTPDILATITARTLVVLGENDVYISVPQAVQMFEAIPQAHLWIVPNGGHLPHLVPENRDDFLRRVKEFLGGEWEE